MATCTNPWQKKQEKAENVNVSQWIINSQTKMQQNLHGVSIEKYKVTGMEDKTVNEQKVT